MSMKEAIFPADNTDSISQATVRLQRPLELSLAQLPVVSSSIASSTSNEFTLNSQPRGPLVADNTAASHHITEQAVSQSHVFDTDDTADAAKPLAPGRGNDTSTPNCTSNSSLRGHLVSLLPLNPPQAHRQSGMDMSTNRVGGAHVREAAQPAASSSRDAAGALTAAGLVVEQLAQQPTDNASIKRELEWLQLAQATGRRELEEKRALVQQLQQTIESLLQEKQALEARLPAPSKSGSRVRSLRDLEEELEKSAMRLQKAERALDQERSEVSVLRQQVEELRASAEGGPSATTLLEQMRRELQVEQSRVLEREASLAAARSATQQANETAGRLRQQLTVLMEAGHRTVAEDHVLQRELAFEKQEVARLKVEVASLSSASEASLLAARAAEDRAAAAGSVCLDMQRQCEAAASTLGRLIEENNDLTSKINAQANTLGQAQREVAKRDAAIKALEAVLSQSRGTLPGPQVADTALDASGPLAAYSGSLHSHMGRGSVAPLGVLQPLERDPGLPGGLSDAEWKLVMLSEEVTRLEACCAAERHAVKQLELHALASEDGSGVDVRSVSQGTRSSRSGSGGVLEGTGLSVTDEHLDHDSAARHETLLTVAQSGASSNGSTHCHSPELHASTLAMIAQMQVVPPPDAHELELRVTKLAAHMKALYDELEALQERRGKLERVLHPQAGMGEAHPSASPAGSSTSADGHAGSGPAVVDTRPAVLAAAAAVAAVAAAGAAESLTAAVTTAVARGGAYSRTGSGAAEGASTCADTYVQQPASVWAGGDDDDDDLSLTPEKPKRRVGLWGWLIGADA